MCKSTYVFNDLIVICCALCCLTGEPLEPVQPYVVGAVAERGIEGKGGEVGLIWDHACLQNRCKAQFTSERCTCMWKSYVRQIFEWVSWSSRCSTRLRERVAHWELHITVGCDMESLKFSSSYRPGFDLQRRGVRLAGGAGNVVGEAVALVPSLPTQALLAHSIILPIICSGLTWSAVRSWLRTLPWKAKKLWPR